MTPYTIIRFRGMRLLILRPLKLLLILVLFLLVLFGNVILQKKEDIQLIEFRAASFQRVTTDWQKVNGSKTPFYVYSAYYLKNPERIQIVGVSRRSFQLEGGSLHCCLYDKDNNDQVDPFAVVRGSVRNIREHWDLNYTACFVTCHLPVRSNSSLRPTYVSLTTGPRCDPQDNFVPIQNNSLRSSGSYDFSVCVKPIYNYDDTWKFQEWMEFHLMMGVKHFTFYDASIGPNVRCLMDKVYGPQVITILPWTAPPLIPQVEIRSRSFIAALNDCIYRHQGVSMYLIMIDLDEMIMPRNLAANYYSQLIGQLHNALGSENRKRIGAYIFQSAFFWLQWSSNNEEIQNDLRVLNLQLTSSQALVAQKLALVRNTRRMELTVARSKYICEPTKVVEAGNHFLFEMEPDFTMFEVPSSLAAVHHYRECDSNNCPRVQRTNDKLALNCVKNLVSRVNRSWTKYTEMCTAKKYSDFTNKNP